MSRADITRQAQLRMFLARLLDDADPAELAGSARSFHRKTAWCWNIEVPRPAPTGVIHDVVIADATYFQGWCLLIATDGRHVIDWQWCDQEKKIAWLEIFTAWPAPRLVVVDGGSGVHAAISQAWPEARVQRCYFHIFQTIRRHLTLQPRLPPGVELLALTRALMKVADLDQAATWLGAFATWDAKWDQFLRHRTYATGATVRPRGVDDTSRWWYTHRDLRKARGLIRLLIKHESLFAWLDPELTGGDPPWPRTTSSLEGGVNRLVKDLLNRHRGMPVDHARRAVGWKLNTLTEHPRDPWSLARPEHWNPPPSRPAVTPEPDPRPSLGTSFSWEDGNGIQRGWAGRPH